MIKTLIYCAAFILSVPSAATSSDTPLPIRLEETTRLAKYFAKQRIETSSPKPSKARELMAQFLSDQKAGTLPHGSPSVKFCSQVFKEALQDSLVQDASFFVQRAKSGPVKSDPESFQKFNIHYMNKDLLDPKKDQRRSCFLPKGGAIEKELAKSDCCAYALYLRNLMDAATRLLQDAVGICMNVLPDFSTPESTSLHQKHQNSMNEIVKVQGEIRQVSLHIYGDSSLVTLTKNGSESMCEFLISGGNH